jgi:primosomal protein N' (replication factor Y)
MPQPLFADPSDDIVEVALPVPVDSLFDYAVPAALANDAEPGRRVVVRFGTRRLTGVIVRRSTRREAASRGDPSLRSIERLLDSEPVLSPALIDMLSEAAADFLCPVGMAVCTALPAGSPPAFVRTYAATARGREALRRGAVRGDAKQLLEALAQRAQSPASVRRRDPNGPARLRELERDGLIAAGSRDRELESPHETVRSVGVAPGVDVEAAVAGGLGRAPRQAALLRQLRDSGPVVAASLNRSFPGAAGLLRALARRNLVAEQRLPAASVESAALRASDAPAVELTGEQARALAAVSEAVRTRARERFLLHGVTGSGKTEVYLRATDVALAAGRQVLVLVPEISLTHQIVARMRARFGDRVAVLHSGLRRRERLAQWRRLERGSTPIAVGARSALFAPLDDLGLIVMDEEHDAAYKSEEGFRYHARDLAARRADRAACPFVMGTATPSIETRFAADRGALQRLVLPRRVTGRPLPAVEIVDLERERASAAPGRKLILSTPLRRAIGAALAESRQVILLINRRGFSTRVFCFDCGHAERCKHCDVSLVYHAAEGRLRCHYCGLATAPPEACAGCGAPDTALLGVGTERVEEEVRTAFPAARIARLDRDAARRRGATEKVLHGLESGALDIAVGTQMLAKGHDFPGVQLVGVIAADLGLHLPDFRAAERTFQLLTQVAGRAGRGNVPGRVIVQTFAPEHYAVRPVRTHDYERFYAEEIGHRAGLGYPPFGALLRVVVSGPDESATQREAERLADAARLEPRPGDPDLSTGRRDGGALEVLGAAPAPVARVRGRFRFQILVKSPDRKEMLEAGQRIVRASARLAKHVRASVDVDPMSML